MSKFTKELIDTYADKLLIGLTSEENEMVLREFDVIEKRMDLINEIPNLDKVIPMTHTLDNFTYELREDEIEMGMDIEDILANCDSYEDREIKVPRVIN